MNVSSTRESVAKLIEAGAEYLVERRYVGDRIAQRARPKGACNAIGTVQRLNPGRFEYFEGRAAILVLSSLYRRHSPHSFCYPENPLAGKLFWLAPMGETNVRSIRMLMAAQMVRAGLFDAEIEESYWSSR
jgi:hypothetical protein